MLACSQLAGSWFTPVYVPIDSQSAQKMCDQGAGVEVIDLTISSDEEDGSRSSTVMAILSDSENSAGFEYVYILYLCLNIPTQFPVEL